MLKRFPGEIQGAPTDNESEHFMTPNGINSVVKHFFNLSGRSCTFGNCFIDDTKEHGLFSCNLMDGLANHCGIAKPFSKIRQNC